MENTGKIKESVLKGYINPYPEDHKQLNFIKPIYGDKDGKKDAKCWLNFHRNDNKTIPEFIPLEADYVDEVQYDIEKIINPHKSEGTTPREPMFMLKIGEKLIYGTTSELLKALFDTHNFDEVRSYDKDYLLVRFMVKNNDNYYMNRHYLKHFPKEERMALLLALLDTHKLLSPHKKNFLKFIKEGVEFGLYGESDFFADFEKSDIISLKLTLKDSPYLKSVDGLIKDIRGEATPEEGEEEDKEIKREEFAATFDLQPS
ncbi:hypothetical protein [Flagellimonas sp.]|uniref:hypothetical protein n=1 Tax=Flagellimonas sp. TaxID=2058762 RepID=UPI003B5A64DC